MLGLNNTVIVKEKIQTTDSRGGATTVLQTKIAALTCTLQPIRREELEFRKEGQLIIDPYLLSYENLTGITVDEGNVVVEGTDEYLVISAGALIPGLGTHTEAILKKITHNAFVQ